MFVRPFALYLAFCFPVLESDEHGFIERGWFVSRNSLGTLGRRQVN